jgi:ribonuclease HII
MLCLPLGPVIGPLVICGYLIEEEKLPALRRLGAKDSKMLTKEQRKELFAKLKKIADDIRIVQIPPQEIDMANMNRLEISRMQEIINSADAQRIIIDAPERNTKKFAQKVMGGLADKSAEIICENYADKNYPEVGAASIIAKVTRDNEIRKLHKIYGNFGSGYTSDERTIDFLKDWIKMNKVFPLVVRKKWITIEEMLREKQQKRLDVFG